MNNDKDKGLFKSFAKKHIEKRKGSKTHSNLTAYDFSTLRKFLLTPTELSNTEVDQYNNLSTLLKFFRSPDGVSRGLRYRGKVNVLLHAQDKKTSVFGFFYCASFKIVEEEGEYKNDTDLMEILFFIRDLEINEKFRGSITRVSQATFDILLNAMEEESSKKQKRQSDSSSTTVDFLDELVEEFFFPGSLPANKSYHYGAFLVSRGLGSVTVMSLGGMEIGYSARHIREFSANIPSRLNDILKEKAYIGRYFISSPDVFSHNLQAEKVLAAKDQKPAGDTKKSVVAKEMTSEEDVIRAFMADNFPIDASPSYSFGDFVIKQTVSNPKIWGLYKAFGKTGNPMLFAVRQEHTGKGAWDFLYADDSAPIALRDSLRAIASSEKVSVSYVNFTRLIDIVSPSGGTSKVSTSYTGTSGGKNSWKKDRDGEKKDITFKTIPDTTGIHWYETSKELLALLAKNVPSGYRVAHGAEHVYWIPDDWDGGIAICAHTDTVWNDKVSVVVKENGTAVSDVYGRGIGADDRSGVLVSEIAAKRFPGKFVHMFFDGEEYGCTGSNGAPVGFPVDFFLSLDRRGNNQVALYGHDNPEVRKAFQDAGGTLAQGSSTDCAALARRFNKCCANLSVGFNDEHRSEESYDPSGVDYALGILGKLEKRQFKGQVPEKDNTFAGKKWGSSSTPYDGATFGVYNSKTKEFEFFPVPKATKSSGASKGKSAASKVPGKPGKTKRSEAFFNNRAFLSDFNSGPGIAPARDHQSTVKGKTAWRSFEDWDDEDEETSVIPLPPPKVKPTGDQKQEEGDWEEVEEGDFDFSE